MSGQRTRGDIDDGMSREISDIRECAAGAAPRYRALDRRGFIRGVALVSGGIAVTAAIPWQAAAQPVAAPSKPQPLSDWTVDDMWGVYPRYADPIGYGRVQQTKQTIAAVDSVDALFYV